MTHYSDHGGGGVIPPGVVVGVNSAGEPPPDTLYNGTAHPSHNSGMMYMHYLGSERYYTGLHTEGGGGVHWDFPPPG